MADVYTGPSVPKMIASHTLAAEIIARANDTVAILDESELAILNSFCQDPSANEALLEELGMDNPPNEKVGDGAQRQGSLAGYIVAKYSAGESVLSEKEITMLRTWFENDMKA